jgi:hypothetical protein
VHYVGYVEDGETPEMIMRKFEELDKIKCKQVLHATTCLQAPVKVLACGSSVAVMVLRDVKGRSQKL